MARNPEKFVVTRSQAKPLLATIVHRLSLKQPSSSSLPIQRPGLRRLLTTDTSVSRDPDLHAYASQYLQELSKALIDDVVKVMDAPPDKPLM
ncbi:DUF3077 domain-containing protein [Pseudomonas fluorescens]|uniref:DUF3077 domain-containing protein n=1 Tax=Pseudomonas fluorescens TaxID=294 RepID=UPI001CD6C5F3|nr:DUF3077 domain-containing protein [Pseudomonas fluorescens]